MNKKLIVMMAAVATAGVMFARPGPGAHGGPRGGHSAPPAMRSHGHGPHHHHHHHGGGVVGAVLGTAAIVNNIVRPAPVVAPAPVVTPAPVVAPAPVVMPAPVVATTYVPPPPPPPGSCRPW